MYDKAKITTQPGTTFVSESKLYFQANKTQYFRLRWFDEKELTAERLLRDC